MVITKKCTFGYKIQGSPTLLSVEVGNGFPANAWVVKIDQDTSLSAVAPNKLELKRENDEDSLCDTTLRVYFLVTRTNKEAHSAIANLDINGSPFECKHMFTDAEKAAESLSIKFRIKVNITC